MQEKIKSGEEISKIAEKLRMEGKIIVTTNGSFDILHIGHLKILEKAKKEGDVLIVLVNSDGSVKKNKGENRPIFGEKARAEILTGLECIDYVVIFDEEKPLRLLEMVRPHKHVKGGSFIEERIREERELLQKWDGKFKNFEIEEGCSTTNIIEKIKDLFSKEKSSNSL